MKASAPSNRFRPPPLHLIAAPILVGRRADVFKFAEGTSVAQSAGLGQQGVERDVVSTCPVINLSGSDQRLEQLRLPLRHQHSEHRAPGVPHQNDLVLLQRGRRSVGQFDSVLYQPIDGQSLGRGLAIPAQRSPSAALIPLHNCRFSARFGNRHIPQGFVASPGPPCSTSTTGLAQSSPRMVTHWSMPPILRSSPSSMPRHRDGVVFGVSRAKELERRGQLRNSSSLAAGRCWVRAEPDNARTPNATSASRRLAIVPPQ